mmetsp:Transcript_63457/g.93002  ORF Transcript_63457/g.93002 Transcript_63457/m.93002 type:complete len:158 (+) Transcript_63457:286-759(+)
MISMVFRESKSPVGSSSRRTSGSFASARAMVTRCCSPPDSSDGRCCMRSRSPTSVSKCAARACRSFLFNLPRRVMGSSTFSKADMVARRLNVWKTNPIFARRSEAKNESLAFGAISVPKRRRVPAVGESIHPIRFSSVVLPPPDGPRRTTNSPRKIG